MATDINDLCSFLDNSPTPYHCVQNVSAKLDAAGFKRVDEGGAFPTDNARFYVVRNESSLVAVKRQSDPAQHGFRLVGAHTDSPCLKVKPNGFSRSAGYLSLAVDVYGGVLLYPWFDRGLALAGRISVVDAEGHLQSVLVDFKRAIATVPSLAIHLNRKVNDGFAVNKQDHLPALIALDDEQDIEFVDLLREQIAREHPQLAVDKIAGFEMSLYDVQGAAVQGWRDEFLASARLDNLLSCYAGVAAICADAADSHGESNQVLVLNDHEEVGSNSTSGAAGPFLESVLARVCGDQETLQRAIYHSMLVSSDNAHGVHPNYAERHEPNHQPKINAGPVIKINHNQRYATNSETEALFAALCQQADIPVQRVVVRSDMGCGSTIGPITATKLGIRTVDIGVPQLGMHSIRELAGVADQAHLSAALTAFYNTANWPF